MSSIKPVAAALGALVVGLAMSQGAIAQNTMQSNNMQNSHNMTNMWNAMDTNGDGSISMREYMAHCRQMFQQADTNGDGKLSKQEGMAAMRKMRRGHMRSDQMNSGQMHSGKMHQNHSMQMWKAMDSNGNGSISMSEAKAYNKRMFRQADTNGDNKLSKSEWMSAMAKMGHHQNGGNGNTHW